MTSMVTQFADKPERYKFSLKKSTTSNEALAGVEIVFLVAHLEVVSFDFVHVPFLAKMSYKLH